MNVRLHAVLVLALFSLGHAAQGLAQNLPLNLSASRVTTRVRSLKEMREEGVVRQRWDLSCGSAALSTLLTHDLGDPTPETAIIVWILRRTDPVRVQSRGGFSLLDLKRFANARGYEAEGYADMSLKDLEDLGRPAIVPIRVKGYDHFVIFRGLRGGRVLVADPAFGNLTFRADRFLKVWKNGISFVVLPRKQDRPPRALQADQIDFLFPEAGWVYRLVRRDGLAWPARATQ
jgi:predicted double-glycine peptidase